MTRFLDTNVLVYAQEDNPHAETARAILVAGGEISVQVLNEFAHVLHRKLRRTWPEIEAALADVRIVLPLPRPLTLATHAGAVRLSRDLGYHFYDALILASALEANCTELLTEDMQDGQTVGPVTIRNPFRIN